MPNSAPYNRVEPAVAGADSGAPAVNPSSTGEAVGEQSRPKRNDSISPFVVIIIVLFWGLQSTFSTFVTRALHHRHAAPAQSATRSAGEFPSDVANGIVAIDVEAKASYLGSAQPSAAPQTAASKLRAAPSPSLQTMADTLLLQSRRSALTQANKLFNRYPDQMILARRVILLRAETGDPNPLGLPQLATQTKNMSAKPARKPADPLAAYAPVKGLPPSEAQLVAGERQLMVELFSSKKPISPSDKRKIEAQLKALPDLRWWGKLALHQAAERAGDSREAAVAYSQISREASQSVSGVALISSAGLLAFVVGIVCLIVLLVRYSADPHAPPESDRSVFAPRAPLIADSERRLGAGDLGALFCVYLMLMVGLEFALGGGLRRYVHSLPYEQQLSTTILLESVLTGLCGIVTFAAMAWLARKRGASLAREIGLNLGGRFILRTIAFGVLGWCLSLPLALVVGLTGQYLFHGAPEPANPVIPMIMSAPSGWPTLVIYILAAFIAPIFEETIFRGLFFNAARLRLGATGAILLTGTAFGLSHPVGIAEQVALGTLGAVLAWMAYTKKSLLPGMVAHFFQNTFAFGQVVFSLMVVSHPHLY